MCRREFLLDKNIIQRVDIRLLAVGVSLLVSLFIGIGTILPNDDAYGYIRTAEIALSDGVRPAIEHYSWAGYSLLIALVSQIGLDLFTAAYLINACFYGLLIYSFISIVKLFNSSRKVVFFAAICVLLYPPLNEFRFEIIRDIAMWALSIFALWHFLLFQRSDNLGNLLVFSISLVFASFFRPEAIIYLFSIPCGLLFSKIYSRGERFRKFLLSWTISLVILTVILLCLIAIKINVIAQLLEFISVYGAFVDNNLNPTDASISSLSSAIFGEYAASYSESYLPIFLTSGLLAVLIVKLFQGIGGPFFWLLLYGAITKFIPINQNRFLPIWIFLITNIGIAFGFILMTRYLSARYIMLFCLLLVLFVPLILNHINNALENSSYRNLGIRVVILFFGYCAFDSFISFGASKAFLHESVEWIATQNNSEAGLLTNNQTIAYNSGKIANYDQVKRFLSETDILNTKLNDLIAIEMDDEMADLVQRPSIEKHIRILTAFPSINDPRLIIYQRIGL